MTTLADLKAELEPFRNTLVIDDFDKVVRLVDVIDSEDIVTGKQIGRAHV